MVVQFAEYRASRLMAAVARKTGESNEEILALFRRHHGKRPADDMALFLRWISAWLDFEERREVG